MHYQKGGRVGLMDEARGLSILLMVLYHGVYDLVNLFGWNVALFHHPVMDFLQPFFAGVFIFVSGMSCRFSKSNLRRGILALFLGAVLSVFTNTFLPGQIIRFGILHLLGVSILLYDVADGLLDRLSPRWSILLLGLFLFTYMLPNGAVGLPGVWRVELPAQWYTTRLGYIVGLPRSSFFSSDYFPLVPWLFLFLAGSLLGRPVREGLAPQWIYPARLEWLATVGRHTLPIYLLHQPLIYALCLVLDRLIVR